MTIINGFKMESARGWYRAVASQQEAEDWLARDSSWQGYTLTPMRYVQYNRSHGWVFIDEDNLVSALYSLFARGTYISMEDNWYAKQQNDEYNTFDANVEAGKNYLVGRDVDTKTFLKNNTTSCSDWQVLAHAWAIAHPNESLVIRTAGRRKFVWTVCLRGNFVEFGLPHHDAGGEKHYVSHIDKPTRKVLVNVD